MRLAEPKTAFTMPVKAELDAGQYFGHDPTRPTQTLTQPVRGGQYAGKQSPDFLT